jgi:hypothetical protein
VFAKWIYEAGSRWMRNQPLPRRQGTISESAEGSMDIFFMAKRELKKHYKHMLHAMDEMIKSNNTRF